MITFALMFHGARILVAPLDWGLGHAARCVPIVKRLIDHGAVPVLGADRGPLALLRQEFPELEYVRIPGVDVRYSKGKSQLWSMARQFPAMVRSVQAERALFDRLGQRLSLDAVISDQRFGIRSAELPSVIITHQVFPFTPFAQRALRQLNIRHLARFDRCWIMDEPDPPGLAGDLSHGTALPANARYIGTVSRLSAHPGRDPERHDVVAVISGPEPQRTMLEHRLIEQLWSLPGKHLLVLGRPDSERDEQIGNLTVRAHLNASDLTKAMHGAHLIVSRSGYTTLMDLAALGRSALIVPTPGQGEQEYLGALHARTGRFHVQDQEGLDLTQALAAVTPGVPSGQDGRTPLLEQALTELASLLR